MRNSFPAKMEIRAAPSSVFWPSVANRSEQDMTILSGGLSAGSLRAKAKMQPQRQ
jgi:hypothetical protein